MAKPRILIVEDEAVSAMALKMCLEAFNYDTCSITSIFLSGYPEEDLKFSLENTGYAGYLVKPFDIIALEKKIEYALKLRSA